MKDQALKQCPFCSAWAALRKQSGLRVVVCTKCSAMSAIYKDSQAAIKAWNRRTENPATQEGKVC